MLNDRKVCDTDNFVCEPSPGPPFKGMETGSWWNTAHQKSKAAENGFVLMPIILYTDSATPDFRLNMSIKPIVVSVGNISGDAQRSVAGKRCIGNWPSLKVRDREKLYVEGKYGYYMHPYYI